MGYPLSSIFLHPSAGFMALAVLLLFVRGRVWQWLLFLPPLTALVLAVHLEEGTHWLIPYLGKQLVLGRVDRLSLIFTGLFAVQSLICTLYAFNVKGKGHQIASLVYMACAFGAILARDYWSFFIFWQLMTVSSVFLIWLKQTPRSATAGFVYLVVLIIGSLFLLAGILLRYDAVGSFAFDPANTTRMQQYDWLILTGFCITAGVVPLHAWLTEACATATLAGSVFLSIFTAKTATYALIRCFPGLEILTILGTLTALYAMVYALLQTDLRRMVAYLMVSQTGLILAGIGVGTGMTLNGALALTWSHTFSVGLLFMAAGCMVTASGEEHLSSAGSAGKTLPLVMIAYLIGALSISAAPLLNGFISAPMILQGAVEGSRPFVAVLLALAVMGGFAAGCLRVVNAAWGSGSAAEPMTPAPVPGNRIAALGMGAALCLIQGILPQSLYRLLPFPATYHPYAFWNILIVLTLLGLAAIAFYATPRFLGPGRERPPDVDALYRWVGTTMMKRICHPLAWVDAGWSEIYRKGGLAGLLAIAAGARWFDRNGIDRVVDGAAHTVRGIGGVSAGIQSGRLQDHLAWMIILALGLFALIWFWL
jgi:multicomponent Na+:H+ antiporter subunit D